MIPVTYQLKGADELAAAFEAAPELVRRRLNVYLNGATMYLQQEIQERTPTSGHGTLRASFTSEVHDLGDSVVGVVGSPLAYAIPVELGTRPHFPPVDAIEDWVNVKLGITGPEGKRVAYAIARKIAARGTNGALMVRRGFDAAEPELERQAELLLTAIAGDLAGSRH
jgi:hypothetical protein